MSANSERPKAERRRVHRHQPRAGTTATYWWQLPPSGHGHAAELHDISEGGLRLIVKKTLEPGTSIQLSLQSPDGGAPVLRVAEVVWCAAQDVTCIVGGRFLEPLSAGELARLS